MRVDIFGVPLCETPRNHPRAAAPGAAGAMCGLFRVPQRGGAGDRVARRRPRARGGGRGGAGWGGVAARRTHPPAAGQAGEARAGQWVLRSTSVIGEGLVSHRGFQPSHSEPAS